MDIAGKSERVLERVPSGLDWRSAGDHMRGDWPTFLYRAGVFLICSAVIWLALYGFSLGFPYVRNGAAVVAEMKRAATDRPLLDARATTRVIAFGNSRILAGFYPDVFDRNAGINVASLNMGLPGEMRFVDLLERMLASGDRPTHVLVQFPPEKQAAESWIELLRDSKRIIDILLPFRDLPRDLTLFLGASLKGGPRRHYQENKAQIHQMLDDRGWFFIRSQSLFPGDQLPDDFRLPTDTPSKVLSEDFPTDTAAFKHLLELANTYKFQIVRIPVPLREGEVAPPERADAPPDALPHFRKIGPDYLLYPASQFSDPVHLNPRGAERYSAELARVFLNAGLRAD